MPSILFGIIISIHLMFLLIEVGERGAVHIHNFNTSHVSINRKEMAGFDITKIHFNTSHVSINHVCGVPIE